MLQVFDSWAGELTPHQFAEFALPPLVYISRKVRRVLAELNHPAVPMTLFPKGVHAPASLALLTKDAIAYDTIGLDAGLDATEARSLLGPGLNLQGNFDPAILYGGREGIEKEVARVCALFHKAGGGWIANLGHGITPNVKPEDMGWFLECVHKYSVRPE
jgi:uroporphyrinogen decarboxylase